MILVLLAEKARSIFRYPKIYKKEVWVTRGSFPPIGVDDGQLSLRNVVKHLHSLSREQPANFISEILHMKHILVVTWQRKINKQSFLKQILTTISERKKKKKKEPWNSAILKNSSICKQLLQSVMLQHVFTIAVLGHAC